MALLFVLALLLVGWQAWRTKPLPPPEYVSVFDPGGLVFPLAVPSWREPPLLPAEREARRSYLESHAVGASDPRDHSLCQLFLRVSSDHWFERPVTAQRLRALTRDRAGRTGPDGTRLWTFRPEGLLDDDDGDGDLLDPGELEVGGAGAEAEAFCEPPPTPPPLPAAGF